jgi:hypothetical protein
MSSFLQPRYQLVLDAKVLGYVAEQDDTDADLQLVIATKKKNWMNGIVPPRDDTPLTLSLNRGG